MGIFLSFLRHPFTTGALFPSGRALAREMANNPSLSRASLIVEVGSGTGAFSGELLARKAKGARLVCIEINPVLVQEFRKKFPKQEVHTGPAASIAKYIRGKKADCVISGIPWAFMEKRMQQRTIRSIAASMKAGSHFSTFAYFHALGMPAARSFRRVLDANFSQVRTSRVVWMNAPPAIVYHCRK